MHPQTLQPPKQALLAIHLVNPTCNVQDFEYSDPSDTAQGSHSPETFASADETFDERHDEGDSGLDHHPERFKNSFSPAAPGSYKYH